MSRVYMAGVVSLLGLAFAPCVSAATLWIPAEQAKGLAPTMVMAGRLGLLEENVLGDFLVPTVTSAAERPDVGCFAEFQADVPRAGTYCIWARVRYPWVGKASFGFVAGEAAKTGPVLPLAESGGGTRDWHWSSQGGADGRPGGGLLAVKLKAGKFTFRIVARETHRFDLRGLALAAGRADLQSALEPPVPHDGHPLRAQ